MEINNDMLKVKIINIIGNNDPYWIDSILKITNKILLMSNDEKVAMSQILEENQYTSKQLNDIFNVVNKVCNTFNIKLDFDNNNDPNLTDIYNLKITKSNINLEKNRLSRTEANKIYDLKKIKDEDYQKYLEELKKFINKYYYESNPNFVLIGRKKFIFDEIKQVLSGEQKEKDPVYFALGSLEEFISNNNTISSAAENYNINIEKNNNYMKYGFICLEEKEIINNLIEQIEKKIIFNFEEAKKKATEEAVRYNKKLLK